jgi:hypothetical protein
MNEDHHLRLLPVVVPSTSADQKNIDKRHEFGASTCIPKPVGVQGLIRAASRIRGLWFSAVILPPNGLSHVGIIYSR